MDVKTPTEEERLWNLRDVARYLGCTPRHVQNLVSCGLPHIRLGRLVRFDREEVAAYLNEHRRLGGRTDSPDT